MDIEVELMDVVDIEQWVAEYLELNFGGMDFWRLSKKWKCIRYRDCAKFLVSEILIEMRIIQDQSESTNGHRKAN
jgi:hypothetical protein